MSTPTNAKSRSALIIEDDEELGFLFAEILGGDDFETHIVRDGAGAFEHILALRPQIIVLDMHLPHVSGIDILHRLRADPEIGATRVIVVTANAHLAERAREEADIVFLKPVSYEQLTSIADRLS